MLAALVLLAPSAAGSGPQPGWNSHEGTTHYAAFSLLRSVYPQAGSTLQVVPGNVERGNGGQALFHQGFDGSTEEPLLDINNGYSNVLYDPDDSFGLGRYRVYYSASVKGAGGGIPGESSDTATLYATSQDGISWDKPALHRYTFNGNTKNNILFQGTTAIGIYDDSFHDKNASSRFKMWGNLPGDEWQGGLGVESLEVEEPRLGFTAQLGGSAVSANGLNWTDYRRFQNPSDSAKVKDTLRFDAQASLFFDSRTQRYTGTMRAFRPCDTCGGCPIWWQPHGGCQVDVERHKDSCDAAQCNRTVRAIGASFSSTDDFQTTKWGPNEVVQRNPEGPERQFYSQISFPFYNVYLGIVMVFSAMDPPNTYGMGFVHCELSWSADGKNYTRISPNKDFIPRGSIENKDFDSHICFASAHPVKLPNETRIYYMGGDGPHYSPAWPSPIHRNSSFGLATLRPDGFVAVRPITNYTSGAGSILVNVSGPSMLITADTAPSGRVSLWFQTTGNPSNVACTIENTNVTDAIADCDLSTYVGKEVGFKVQIDGRYSALYTIGFR